MLELAGGTTVYLACGATDLRKSYNGLAAIIKLKFQLEEQLNNMSRENMIEVLKIMQEQSRKKENEIQLLKDRQKELEFMNAMLADRLSFQL